MYRVFSRQTESADISSTALGLQQHVAHIMDACTLPEALDNGSQSITGSGLAYAAAPAGTRSPRASAHCTLERKPTPAFIPDVFKRSSSRRHRRSCHGTVFDDQQQGGTAASRSCPSLAHDSSQTSDGMAFVLLSEKATNLLKAEAICKDVCCRQQSDQQQHGIAHHPNGLKDTAVHSLTPATIYATPFAAPEVQACRCHKRYKQCKQHPHSQLKKLANQLKGLVQCGGCQTAY